MIPTEFELTDEQKLQLSHLFSKARKDYKKNRRGSIIFQVYENRPAEGFYFPIEIAKQLKKIIAVWLKGVK